MCADVCEQNGKHALLLVLRAAASLYATLTSSTQKNKKTNRNKKEKQKASFSAFLHLLSPGSWTLAAVTI